jgi:MFS family permease
MTDEEGSFTISIIGISNTIARLVLGLISQKINRLFLYNTCLVFCGISMSLSNYFQPFLELTAGLDCSEFIVHNVTATDPNMVNATMAMLANSTDIVNPPIPWQCSAYIGQVIYALCFGVTSAAYVLLTTLVLADLLGPAMFTNSFGLLLLFQGVATIIGPPIVGYMFDVYGNYDYGFILMGLFITFSGLMLYPVPWVQRRIQRGVQKSLERSQEVS